MRPESTLMFVMPPVVEKFDAWVDERHASIYEGQPLAHDWDRVAKLSEEVGEAVQEMILYMGSNRRKGQDPEARLRLLAELADVAMGAIYAIQHFTKDLAVTHSVMIEAQKKHMQRVAQSAK